MSEVKVRYEREWKRDRGATGGKGSGECGGREGGMERVNEEDEGEERRRREGGGKREGVRSWRR